MTDTQDLKRYKYGYSSDEWGMGRSLGLIPDPAGKVCLFADAHAKLEAAQAEIEAVRKANIDCVNHFDALRIDYDRALARLAEIEKQEPVAQITVATNHETKRRKFDFEPLARIPDGISELYAAAGASPVEVKALQDQVVDLTDSRDFYKRRVDLLQQWQSKMRDPERTICCDIIANGQTLPPENAGNRYAVQPIKAEKLLGAAVRSLSEILECPYDLDEATISSCGLEETMRLSPYQVVGNMSVALGRVRNAKAIIAAINAKGAACQSK